MPNIKIGYEVELLSPLEHTAFGKALKAVGIKPGAARHDYADWFLTYDGSLRGSGNRGEHGHELISPIMDLEPGLAKMGEVFAWMEANGHYTNSSCGFHVGVSVADKDAMKKIDVLKLMLLFDHGGVLRKFQRANSNYCRNLKTATLDQIKRNARFWNERQGNWDGTRMSDAEKIRRCIPHEKFTTTNLSKLDNAGGGGYVEFRAMGGEGYHQRYAEVAETIRNYADVMLSATDPERDIVRYTRRLESFNVRVQETIGVERERYAAEIENQRKKEEARLRPLLERDTARRHNRVLAAHEQLALRNQAAATATP